MSLIVEGGKVLDGTVIVPATETIVTQPVAMAGRKQQTISVQTDKALTFDVQISMGKEGDDDYVTTGESGLVVGDNQVLVVDTNHSCNFMRIVLHGGAADALPVAGILTQPNAN
jgi:hypothetical protein